MSLRQIVLLRLISLFVFTTLISCTQGPVINTSKFPGTKKGAEDLLSEFTKVGITTADMDVLTEGLRPTKQDFRAIFNKRTYTKAWDRYNDHFFSDMVIRAEKDEHWMRIYFLTSNEINNDKPSPENKSLYNYGYYELSGLLKDDLLLCHFVFTKADKGPGSAWHSLIYVNNHWVFINDPWTYLR